MLCHLYLWVLRPTIHQKTVRVSISSIGALESVSGALVLTFMQSICTGVVGLFMDFCWTCQNNVFEILKNSLWNEKTKQPINKIKRNTRK